MVTDSQDTTGEDIEIKNKLIIISNYFWEKYTNPSLSITSKMRRQRVRILLRILLVFILFSSLSIVTTIILTPSVIHIVVASLIILILIYTLARTKHVRLAAYAFAFVPPLAITGALMLPGMTLSEPSTRAAFYNAALGLFLAGLIMDTRDFKQYSILFIIWFFLTLFLEQYPFSEWILLGREIFFLAIVGIITFTGTHLRLNYLEKLESSLEKTKQAKKEAESANEARMTFFASMSHELRTPLNSIIGFSHFLLQDDDRIQDQERVNDFARRINQSGHQLLYLVNDILDISAMISGSFNLNFENDVKLMAILDEVKRNTVDGLSKDRPLISYQCHITPDIPLMIADPIRVRQILNNLISNAFKFTEKGFVRISATYDDSLGVITIAVEDSGKGIPVDEQDTVFKPFEQAVDAIRVSNGTGLGMPISKSLTEAHGGSLNFESEFGKGTTFYCRLPVKPPSHLLEKYNYGEI